MVKYCLGNENASDLSTTPNQRYQAIWRVVQLIPSGKVATYGQVADLAGLPGRARMVGKALGKVPKTGWLDAPVPWFRVINSHGKISFPQGSENFTEQRQRLMSDDVVVIGARISLKTFQWRPDLAELLFKLSF